MAKTLRKQVDEWIIFWERQEKHTESLELFIAKKAIESVENVDKF
jgi:hypothetical protein